MPDLRALPPFGLATAPVSASAASAGAVVVTVPPAACTAAIAAAEAPVTVSVTARLISPFASRRTPTSLEEVFTTPAAFSAASSIGAPAGSRPSSIAWSSVPRFSTAYSLRNGLTKPRFGIRR